MTDGTSHTTRRQPAPDSPPQVILRAMTLDDIQQVYNLDRLSFPTPWPIRTYRYEVEDNEHSHMWVLEPVGAVPVPVDARSARWWQRLLQLGGENGNGNGNGHRLRSFLCGYSGMWHIADEAHISTIAVHPDWRGRRLGELLVWCMIRQAMLQGAAQVTLEVRVSNTPAQTLYRKYGFEVMGLRKGYYRDNAEDAYMMAVMRLDHDYRERLNAFGRALARQVRVVDQWWGRNSASGIPPAGVAADHH
jgi:[ribosomal protein S18]-alanine N-acetyltransferase